MRNKEIAKEIFIEAQQIYEKYDTLNPGAIIILNYERIFLVFWFKKAFR